MYEKTHYARSYIHVTYMYGQLETIIYNATYK